MTVLKAYGGRSAIEATVEPSGIVSRSQRVKIPDGRRLADRAAGFYRAEGRGREGYPYTYRRKKRKK
jgi:hypothetical protein